MPADVQHNHKVIDQHNRQAAGYAWLTGQLAEPGRSGSLRARIGTGPDDEVLDVACGPGRLSLDLAPHVRRVTGVDLTPGMLEQARAALASSGNTNVVFVEGDAAALPFPEGAFSIVISSAAFHHFAAPSTVLAEMVRVCRPGGRVVISDVTPAPDKGREYDRMEKLHDPSHGHAHGIDELTKMGQSFGLSPPETFTSLSGPMPNAAVLATSFPEGHTREELLEIMRGDAVSGENRLGFSAALKDGEVLVSYPMSQVVWTRP